MKNLIYGTLFSLMALSGNVKAEGACPSGQYQTTPAGPGPIGCAPIPSSRSSAKWLDQWGAIANDSDGHWGISSEVANKKKAQAAALEDCQERQGKDCILRITYHNQCVAAAANGSIALYTSAASEKEAINDAMRRCEKEPSQKECWIYYSGCSLPVKAE
jgi:hypothetical protein